MTVEEVFEKLVGMQPSDEQRARLLRIRDALGLQDNDAFWSIVMALELYDSIFRTYPAELGRTTAHCIERARASFEAAAQVEAARAERLLAERVGETSAQIARKLAERPLTVHGAGAAVACLVAFGTLCMRAGYSLATCTPPWRGEAGGRPTAERALGILLSLPAGWMIFALLVPAACYGVRVGWTMSRDPGGSWRDRALGACLAIVCALGTIGCGVVIGRVT